MKQWTDLTENQTEETIKSFWKEYCEAEIKVYSDVLANADTGAKKSRLTGRFGDLVEKYGVDPVLFMGFIDGVTSSLAEGCTVPAGAASTDLDSVDEDSDIDLDIDLEKLYFNMLKADAKHLYTIEGWDSILSEDEKKQITKDFRRSGTVVKGKKIGRNDPCPCGSGKKYKHCCGRNA